MNNIISTKATIFRNVKDYKFVPKLTSEQKEEITQKLSSVFPKFTLLNLPSSDGKIVKFLRNNNLISSKTTNVLVSKDETISINLFEGEHISIVASSSGYDKQVFAKVKEQETLLANKISLSFSDEYGYLMSDLSKIGAGIKLECVICLPAIKELNKIDQVKQNIRKLGYLLKETNNPCEYSLSTICNLGYSEKEIYEEFDNMVIKLQDLEVESAKMLDVTNHDVITDRTLRSLAILNSAYLMTYDELKKLIVNLRMGVNLGLIKVDIAQLNKLNALTSAESEFISETETKELAEKVKNILKGEQNV